MNPHPLTEAAWPEVRLCALLTTFNRRALTLSCLQAFAYSARAAGVAPRAIVVDDASRDGTPTAIAAQFPWVRLIVGSGELFWSRGMHRAFAEALAAGFDHYLWLNDDTVLHVHAVATLLGSRSALLKARGAPVIVVGSTVDPDNGRRSYGGESRPSRLFPLQVAALPPAPEFLRCQSMTGNLVLIPADAAARVGNLDPAFEHAMGDTDYAFRAARAGVELWQAPGVLGECRANVLVGGYRDATLPLARRWRAMMHRKGLPWRSWLRFSRRHGGLLWPAHFASPYVRVLGSTVLRGRVFER